MTSYETVKSKEFGRISPAAQALKCAVAVTIAIAGMLLTQNTASAAEESTIFAGGCFWCVESDFEHVPGVLGAVSGYTGGHLDKDVTYQKVTAGGTGHREAVKITYDSETVSFEKLVDIFWRSVDPTDAGGQFCDRGESYSTAIYATSDEQFKIATESKEKLNESSVLQDPIVTPIIMAGVFHDAEEYHQDYYKKNPIRYKFYRYRCGRDSSIESLWGDQAHAGIPGY